MLAGVNSSTGGAAVSLTDDALNYLGLGGKVDVANQTFTDASYADCVGKLAELLVALGATETACGAFTGLLVGEVPSLGADTWATLLAGAACYEAYSTYTDKAQALAQCLANVDSQASNSVASAGSTIASNLQTVSQQAVAMSEQQGGSTATV
jgi:hypothetical protein